MVSMIPLPKTSSPSTLRTRRVSPCEPLCARLEAGVACVCPTRGSSARTGRILGRHKNGEYAAVTRGRPAFQRHEAHAEGSDTTPMQKCRKSTVCRREQLVRRCRAPALRKPFFCRNKPRAGLFRHSHSGRRVVIPPPHRSGEKNAKRGFLSPPPTGLPPKPGEAVSVGR